MPYLSARGILDGHDAYDQVICDVAVSTGALLVDAEDAIPGDAANVADSVHLADAGSRATAIRVAGALIEASQFRHRVDVELKREGVH